MTSNTTISSCTVLPLSVVVPWAGERVNVVTPPNRSIKCSRTAAYFSAPGASEGPVQKRSIPNKKSSATVTTAESSSDPRQPRRFEKKKNMSLP
jgi:hypothetical protein